jgi:hypothetical protein
MDKKQRREFLLLELRHVGRVNRREKTLYLPYDAQLSITNLCDIAELKYKYKYIIQYHL